MDVGVCLWYLDQSNVGVGTEFEEHTEFPHPPIVDLDLLGVIESDPSKEFHLDQSIDEQGDLSQTGSESLDLDGGGPAARLGPRLDLLAIAGCLI